MNIGKLYFGWGSPPCQQSQSLQQSLHKAREKISELENELEQPRALNSEHDREVLLNYMNENAKDELDALDHGLDHHWRRIDK